MSTISTILHDFRSDGIVGQLDFHLPLNQACLGLGGTAVIGLLTPLRNAMTLGAKDIESSQAGLYRQVFKDGPLQAWRGGLRPSLSAFPQFLAIGPVSLFAGEYFNSPTIGLLTGAIAESLFTFPAQRSNAQIQYNASISASQHLPHQPMHHLVSPGFTCHVLRNVFATTGIRLIAPYTHHLVQRIPGSQLLNEEGTSFVSDLIASVPSATLSMPCNQIFSWSACTPKLMELSLLDKAKLQAAYIIKTYADQGALKLLWRDMFLRINYLSMVLAMYRAVERQCVG